MPFESTDELLKRLIFSLSAVWSSESEIKALRAAGIKGTHFDWDIGWKSVSEELPRPNNAGYSKMVLTIMESITGKKTIALDRYDWDNECWEILHLNGGVDCDRATHWMPLPEVL
jgi:hypothetical protein